jgi:hypothetical protein
LPDPGGEKSQPKRVGAIPDSDGMLAAAGASEFFLESFDKRAAGEGDRVDDFGDRFVK